MYKQLEIFNIIYQSPIIKHNRHSTVEVTRKCWTNQK